MDHPIEVHPEYLAELRRLIEAGPGMKAVAQAAHMSRTTLWGLLNEQTGRPATADSAERVRRALAKLQPDVQLPPPVVSVKGPLHHRWMVLGDELIEKHREGVAALLDAPSPLLTLIKSAKVPARRR